jgi:hypothetical protein
VVPSRMAATRAIFWTVLARTAMVVEKRLSPER